MQFFQFTILWMKIASDAENFMTIQCGWGESSRVRLNFIEKCDYWGLNENNDWVDYILRKIYVPHSHRRKRLTCYTTRKVGRFMRQHRISENRKRIFGGIWRIRVWGWNVYDRPSPPTKIISCFIHKSHKNPFTSQSNQKFSISFTFLLAYVLDSLRKLFSSSLTAGVCRSEKKRNHCTHDITSGEISGLNFL